MKLTITVTDMKNNSYDIQVDERQRIGTTLRVMEENLPGFAWKRPKSRPQWQWPSQRQKK